MRRALEGAPFGALDVDSDGALTREDFRILTLPRYKLLLSKTEDGNEDWIWDNYFRVTMEWLDEHYQLEANKTRLARLDLPIYVFHGEADANTDVRGVRDLKASFDQRHKTNLQVFVFEGHDHDLNFLKWIFEEELPPGIAKIFEVAGALSR